MLKTKAENLCKDKNNLKTQDLAKQATAHAFSVYIQIFDKN